MAKPGMKLLIVLLAMLAACSPDSPRETENPGLRSPEKGLPALESLREVSEIIQREQLGSEAFERSPMTEIDGEYLVLDSGLEEPAWAIWALPAKLEFVNSVSVTQRTGEQGEYMLALADFASGRWVMQGSHNGAAILDLDNDNRSSFGNVFVAVICSAGQRVSIGLLNLVVEEGWSSVVIGTPDYNARRPRLAVVDGHPAMCFRDVTNDNLIYVRSVTAMGLDAADWSNVVMIDSDQAGTHADLAVISGNPAIAYQGGADNILRYARSSSPTGSLASSWTVVTVDPGTNSGRHASLATIDGRPAIAYQDNSNDPGTRLHYAISSTASGDSQADWSVLDLDLVIDIGQGYGCSLAQVVGRPGIVHSDELGGVAFRHASTADGAAFEDWSSAPVSNESTLDGYRMSLIVADGHPATAWYDEFFGDRILYSRSSTPQGGSGEWGFDFAVANHPYMLGYPIDMELVAGRPAIAYVIDTLFPNGAAVELTWSSTASGRAQTDWDLSTRIGYCGGGDPQVCLLDLDGIPAVAYLHREVEELIYAVWTPQS